MIDPYNSYYMIWCAFVMLVSFIQFIACFLKIAFNIFYNDDLMLYYFLFEIPLIIFLIDIIIKFFVPYYEFGKKVVDFKNIFRNYMFSDFFIDLIPSLALIFS